MRVLLFAFQSLLLSLPGAAEPAETSPPLSLQQIAESGSPAVVLIEVDGEGGPLQGSGFVVGETGLIATSLHVLDKATKVTVSLSDRRRYQEVAVLAFDVEQDLAVLQVHVPADGDRFPTIDLGHSASIRPGDRIVVISNPFGLTHTLSEGIVSAWREPQSDGMLDPMEDVSPRLPLPARRVIQISAAISPGSSGGPVFNEKGEVIGVAMAGVLYGMADLNFAVPVDDIPGWLPADNPMDLDTFRVSVERARYDLAHPFLETAQLAFERDDIEEALRNLGRAIMLFPSYESALLLAGRIRMDEGDLDQAERLFVRAVEANPHSAEGWYRLARLYDVQAADSGSLSAMARAETAYRKCLELDEGNADAAYALAMLQMHRGNQDEAMDLLRMAIRADSGMADAHTILGMILLERGRIAEAERSLRQAIWENPDLALAYFGLAQVLMARELKDREVKRSWERFFELSEDDPSLVREREIAIQLIARYYPEMLGNVLGGR